MQTAVKILNSMTNVMEFICKFIGGVSVFGFVTIISLQVILRTGFRIPLIWANDVSIVLFVWSVFFGSAIAVLYRSHFVMEVLPEKYKKTDCVFDIISALSGYVLFGVMLVYGYDYTIMGLRRLSPSLNIPQAYFYACIPLAAIFMLWFNTRIFITDIKRLIKLCKEGNPNE